MRRLWKWLVLGVVVVVGWARGLVLLLEDSTPSRGLRVKETPIVTTTTVAGQAPASTDPTLDGTWTVKPGNTQNFVGYRVTEKLFANISESEATGRTDQCPPRR